MTLTETLQQAVADLTIYGYDSQTRVDAWLVQIRMAAEAEAIDDDEIEALIARTLHHVYESAIDKGGLLKVHPGVSPYTIQRVKPRLRAELDRRLAANRQLIKLDRENAVDTTERRFAGWATSIPAGGSKQIDRREVRQHIAKPIQSLPYVQRRLAIDQGAKLFSAVSEIVAVDEGAIAGRWRSHWRENGYSFRPAHKALDNHVFAVRGSWAIKDGLINKGAGYTDEIDQPAFLPYCRCWWVWLYALRDLPQEMITKKGVISLDEARKRLRS